MPDDSRKLFYSIGEVAAIFKVNESTLRFWEKEFPTTIKPRKNAKGTRSYTKEDIESVRLVYFLVKEKGMTLAGARKRLREEKKGMTAQFELAERLKKIKADLLKLQDELGQPAKEVPEVEEEPTFIAKRMVFPAAENTRATEDMPTADDRVESAEIQPVEEATSIPDEPVTFEMLDELDEPIETNAVEETQEIKVTDAPDENDLPDVPDEDDLPDLPDESDLPDLPDESDLPDLPDESDLPDLPDEDDLPDLPDESDFPDVPDNEPLEASPASEPAKSTGGVWTGELF